MFPGKSPAPSKSFFSAFAMARSANLPNACPPPRSASSTPAPSLAALLQRHSVNVLPTALVIVETGEKTLDTAALIDPCTPTHPAAFNLPTVAQKAAFGWILSGTCTPA